MKKQFLSIACILFISINTFSQLNGTKTIGGSSPDYNTISEAVDDLVSQGIDGNLIFNIREGIYYDSLYISGYAGQSDHTVTFQSEDIDSSKVTIIDTINGEFMNDRSTITLDNVEHMIFKHLSVKRTGGSHLYDKCILTSGNCKNIEFSNNVFEFTKTKGYGIKIVDAMFSDTNIIINNNHFINNSISVSGSGNNTHNVRITNNIIDSGWVSFQHSDSIIIENNKLLYYSAGAGNAISINTSKDYYIMNNIIQSYGSCGLYINMCYSDKNSMIYNNFIITTINDLAGSSVLINKTQHLDFIFNSINTHVPEEAFLISSGMDILETEQLNVYNNNIVTDRDYALKLDDEEATGIVFDYNNYYADSGLFYLNNSKIASLSDWQDSTGFDQHSINADPEYNSFNDLHISSAELESKALLWQGITTDFDGDQRNQSTPDIGADEADLLRIPALTNNNDNSILIYPNPADGHFNLMIDPDEFSAGLDVIMFDMNGKVMYYREVNNNNMNINTKQLTPGYYIVLVRRDNNILHREKVIIR